MSLKIIAFLTITYLNFGQTCNEQNGPFCNILQWSAWSNCSTTCGAGIVRREKYLCCDLKKYSTLNGCLMSCSITNDWWQKHSVQTKTCGHCHHNGVFNYTSKQCLCKNRFGGQCCDVRTTRRPTTTVKTTIRRRITTKSTTITLKPTTTTQKPTTTTQKPTTTTQKPTTTTLKPTTTTQKPTTTTQKPTTTTQKPTTATQKPTTTRQKPTTTTQKPHTPIKKPTTTKLMTTSQKPTTTSIRSTTKTFNCYYTPCRNGTCAYIGTRFTCVCSRGYEGRYCEIDKNDCASEPCVNGKCYDEVDNFHCECPFPFTGKQCGKIKLWVVGSIAGAIFLALLACCCCLWFLLPTYDRDEDEEDTTGTAYNNKIRPKPMQKPRYHDW